MLVGLAFSYLYIFQHPTFIMSDFMAVYHPEDSPAPRLNYTLNWIFSEQLKVPYQIFTNKERWLSTEGYKINYSKEKLKEAQLQIRPNGLLAELNIIEPKPFAVQRWKRKTVLFYNNPRGKIPFDLFSAVFFMLSRYEEYLPHSVDKHDRFDVSDSVAMQYRFLGEPVVDQWLTLFSDILKNDGVALPKKKFEWRMTFDVDMAWKYRNRGKVRYWGGHARDFFKINFKGMSERRAVVSEKMEDPYYSFPELEKLHQQYGVQPTFFMLLGEPGKYDRNMVPKSGPMQDLMKQLSSKYAMGIHPSYGSQQHAARVKKEMDLLAASIGRPVTKSRQHYIKFVLPKTYRNLISLGIREDYSMGFAARNGFRAGTSCSFYWYDLQKEKQTALRVFPFAFMDATSRFYLKQSPAEMIKEWKRLLRKAQEANGSFICIWHNYILSRQSDWLKAYGMALDFLAPVPKS